MMLAPFAILVSWLGAIVGTNIADERRGQRQRKQIAGCLLLLPLFAVAESKLPDNAQYVVISVVEIDAAPEVVWHNVVDFPPLAGPEPWLFRWGIAGPKGARIDGRGVGAVRRCDFTTGSFVEPITAWDEPRRLAFDVTDQPEPLFELTPYREIHPPHLKGSFRSSRGEFVLKPLPNGRTRLTGKTWYRLDLAPAAYWTVWTDWIIHRIHLRVLEHVKALAESQSEPVR